jgi:ATP-dependent Lon protease
MVKVVAPIPVVSDAHVLLPSTVNVLFPKGSNLAVLNQLADEKSKFVLVKAEDDEFEGLSNSEIMSKRALLCSVLEKTVFPDSSTRFLIKVDSRVVLDDVYESATITDNISYMRKAEYHEFVLSGTGDAQIESTLATALAGSYRDFCTEEKDFAREKLQLVKDAPTLLSRCDTIFALLEPTEAEKESYLLISSLKELVVAVVGKIDRSLLSNRLLREVKLSAKNSIDRNQKQYYLNEQLKAVQKELSKLYSNNDGSEDKVSVEDSDSEVLDEVSMFRKKAEQANMPPDVLEKCKAEIKKLSMQAPLSAESGIVRGYIETLLALPWKKKSPIKKNLALAKKILDEDHYGLEKVKESILEYLAVQSRADRLHAPIICLVGPPGVGKTSLGKSIAKATGRKYVRVALGGMHDESEVRGHRRTYIGAMPGKIIQKISKCGVRNPLFLLDEIDKVSTDTMRGDPSAALLEVLDPEQNKSFSDNYLEVDFDLSDVMFMATSNSMNIPYALRDRMEIIELSSYTEDEKLHIALNHLLPKQLECNGVKKGELDITDDAILGLIRFYTREAGVRNLERKIGELCRKAIKEIMLSGGAKKHITIDDAKLPELLGPRIFDFGEIDLENQIGIVNGLAYTSVGGDLLKIEAVSFVGYGKQVFTGKLGDVMKESMSAAITVVRARANKLHIDPCVFNGRDLHIHCPEGAVPKDGPSAGVTICTAIASSLTGNPVRGDVAMTGEITLRGEVLPIGGLREKLLAAMRGGIKKVLIPKANVKDLEDVPQVAKDALEIVPVSKIEEVFKEALLEPYDSYIPSKEYLDYSKKNASNGTDKQ